VPFGGIILVLRAFTRAIIIEYIKPWKGNQSKELQSILVSDEYPFLRPVIANHNDLHEALLEFRDKIVAHVDHGFQSTGVTLRGGTINNVDRTTGIPYQMPNRHDEVFMPLTPRAEIKRANFWIDNKDKWEEILALITESINATNAEMTKAAATFRDLCFEHMPVLKSLQDIVHIEEMDIKEGRLNYTRSKEQKEKFKIGDAKPTKIGDINLNTIYALCDPSPIFPKTIEVEGKGYRLTISETVSGESQFDMAFLDYPGREKPQPTIAPRKAFKLGAKS
jgi:hypothetical protein